jgi:hypothetical protein
VLAPARWRTAYSINVIGWQSDNLVTEDENVFIGDVALSPNGTRVAYVDSASVEPARIL